MKTVMIAVLAMLAMATLAAGATTVLMLGTYSNASSDTDLNTWGMYALDPSLNADGSTNSNDGIAYVSFKATNILAASNVSPLEVSYAGDGRNTIKDMFGFSNAHQANDVGGGVFEVICGQDPGTLQAGTVDPHTGSPLFLKHLGQSVASYTVENDDGSQTVRTAGELMTLGGVSGYWIKVAEGNVARGAKPDVVDYLTGASAGANVVDTDLTYTHSATNVSAAFVPEPATLTLLAVGGLAALARRRKARQ